MNEDRTETSESPFRSFLLLTGACLGLAALWWLRENVWDPHGPGVPADGPRGPRPAGGSATTSEPAKAAPAARAATGASAAEKAPKAKTATPSPAEKSEPKAANDDAPTKKTAKKKSASKAAAGKSAADDLSTIEGIGPKIAQVLTEAGVGTFAELAAKSADEIRELLIAVNPRYRMFDPETWPEQARLAAAGDFEKLSALQGELDGGRRA